MATKSSWSSMLIHIAHFASGIQFKAGKICVENDAHVSDRTGELQSYLGGRHFSKTNSYRVGVDFFPQGVQSLARQAALDIFKQLVLFPADMGSKEGCEFEQQAGAGRGAQAADERFDPPVVGDQAREPERSQSRGRECALPNRSDWSVRVRSDRWPCGRVSPRWPATGRPAGALGEDAERQAVVVLVGERNQTGVAEHKKRASLSMAGSRTERPAA